MHNVASTTIYDQFDAAFRYAKSDRKRFYPGGDHRRTFDDPRLGELLADYHATRSDESHNRLLGHLRETQPVANHFLDYLDRVGGPTNKPYIGEVTTQMVRNPVTQNLEAERGDLTIDHRRQRGADQTPAEEPSGHATIHLGVVHPHQGKTYIYRLAVPNFHPEHLAKERTAGQREQAMRLVEGRRKATS